MYRTVIAFIAVATPVLICAYGCGKKDTANPAAVQTPAPGTPLKPVPPDPNPPRR